MARRVCGVISVGLSGQGQGQVRSGQVILYLLRCEREGPFARNFERSGLFLTPCPECWSHIYIVFCNMRFNEITKFVI